MRHGVSKIMTTKKVLIIVENLPVPHDKRVWQEAKSLTAAGYQVSIISPKGHGANLSHEVIDSVSIYRYPLPIEARRGVEYILEYGWSFLFQLWLAVRIFKKTGFDVIHACNPPDNIFLIALVFKLFFKTKFVFDHHDGNLELWLVKGGKNGLVYHLLALLEKLSFMTADVSLAVNDHYVSIAKKRGGMDSNAVFQVRNAPPRQMVDHILEKASEVVIGCEKTTIIGYLGVMGKQDGVDNLVKIANYLVNDRQRNDIVFRIMGDGPELGSIKKLVKEYKLENNVKFTGWISGDNYIKLLSTCDVCVNADEVNDYNMNCSPNKIYEYMLFGIPIVQFDMPEPRVVAGEAALYAQPQNNVDFAEKILELVDNREKRVAMGKTGRQRFLDYFTWDNSERTLIEAYSYLFKH